MKNGRCSWALLLLLACSAVSGETLGCGDYQYAKVKSGLLYNNVWNKGAAGDFAWKQCLQRDPGDGSPGWSWQWPEQPGNIYGYPQLKLGISPWDPVPGFDARLPIHNTAVKSLRVTADLEFQGTSEFNVATTFWLTTEEITVGKPRPETIVAELMVWTYQTRNHLTPAGTRRATARIGDASWEIWVQKDWQDMSGQNGNRWTYLTFRQVDGSLRARFDLAPLLDYGIHHQYLPDRFFVSDLELGTEIQRGQGEVRVRGFDVDVVRR